jgi:hypothetical protein
MSRLRVPVVVMLGLRVPVVVMFAFALLGIVSGTAAASTTSSTAADTIQILSAGSPLAHVGDLSVVADSSVAISGMTVTLSDSSSADVLDVTLSETGQSVLPSGQIQSSWAVSTPIAEGTPPTGLPLGIYQISVNATFQDQSSTTVQNAGTLDFIDVPQLSISPTNPPQVNYANPMVTLSGRATLLAPDGTVSPYDPGTVTLVTSWEVNGVLVKLDSNGNYSTTVSPQGTGAWAFTQLPFPQTNGMVVSPSVDFNVQVDPAQVTASLSSKTVTYGGKETVSGSVTYQPTPTSTYQPVRAGEVVDVFSSQNPYSPVAKGATDAKGNFAIALPNTTGTIWTVKTAGSAGDPLLGLASKPVSESVNIPTAITNFHATLNQYGTVSFSGCLGLTKPISGTYVSGTSGLAIQWAARSNGPWQTLTKGYQLGNGCGTHGIWFSGKATAKLNYAFYRAHYPGSPGSATPTAPKYLPSTSNTVLAWKYADRIVSFSASPHVVDNGGKLSVKGQLEYYYRTWHGYGGQQVLIILRPEGSDTWYWIVKVTTNSSGHFSASFTDPVSATWAAEFQGNSTHLAAVGAMIYVRLSG